MNVELLAQRFPSTFLGGAATAAYQIEGEPSADGKGPSVWDEFCRRPSAIADASSATQRRTVKASGRRYAELVRAASR